MILDLIPEKRAFILLLVMALVGAAGTGLMVYKPGTLGEAVKGVVVTTLLALPFLVIGVFATAVAFKLSHQSSFGIWLVAGPVALLICLMSAALVLSLASPRNVVDFLGNALKAFTPLGFGYAVLSGGFVWFLLSRSASGP